MTAGEKLLIAALSDHLRGVPKTESGEAEIEEALEISRGHGLAGIAFAQLGGGNGPDRERKKLSAIGTCAVGYVRRRENYEELKNAFEENGLWFVPVKGILIAEEYPEPALRVMGDTDIIVGKNERKAVENLLKTLGYRETSRTGDTGSFENATGSLDVRAGDPAETGITVPEDASAGEILPDRTEHFVYLIAHLANHIKETGCGIRQFFDIAVMTNSGGIDGEKALELLRKKGLEDFAGNALCLVEKWFGTKAPFEIAKCDDEVISALEGETLKSGVFGRKNEKNELLFSARNATDGAGPVRLFFRRLFPPYRQMKMFGYCGWLNGRPWLLPAAWIVRIFRCVFTRTPGESWKTATEPFTRRTEIEERASYLKRLGIPVDREFF